MELNEWRSQLNACKTEMGLNSSASVANKKAINQCNRQIQLQEEAIYQKVHDCLNPGRSFIHFGCISISIFLCSSISLFLSVLIFNPISSQPFHRFTGHSETPVFRTVLGSNQSDSITPGAQIPMPRIVATHFIQKSSTISKMGSGKIAFHNCVKIPNIKLKPKPSNKVKTGSENRHHSDGV